MHILVTGGLGFIGRHLCERLLTEGYEVSILDDLSGHHAAEESPFLLTSAHSIKEDITHLAHAGRLSPSLIALGTSDLVIHLAARAGVRASLDDPCGYAETNILGTINVLEACRLAGVGKVIFASSSSVYGDPELPGGPSWETDDCHPRSPYGWTKLAGEQLCETYARLYNMQILCLRLFSVYGPRQRPDLALPIFARQMLAGHAPKVFGDGTSTRDYTYIDDIVEGFLRGIAWCQVGMSPGLAPVVNLGSGVPVSISDMIDMLSRALGVPRFAMECLPIHPADAETTHAAIGRARTMLGWAPEVPFAEGIQYFAAWMLAQAAVPDRV